MVASKAEYQGHDSWETDSSWTDEERQFANEVRAKPALDRFIHWIRERHQIALRRKTGLPKPWTADPILRRVFFTHPYREWDKVTIWFRENIRDPLLDQPEVLFATVAFRWFNLPETAQKLCECPIVLDQDYHLNLFCDWDPDEAYNILGGARAKGEKIFTGAYMINSPAGKPKLDAIIERIDQVWQGRDQLLADMGLDATLEEAHGMLQRFSGMGGFMAYEVVTDLRHTYLLENATDIMTWANPGPGAIRGMCRLLGIDFPKGQNSHGFTPSVKFDFQEEARKLLKIMQQRLPTMPKFDMRTVEHSCCEYDKYERALWGDGKVKRKYNGT